MSVLMDSREVVALGWTLLHFCWQSTIIALLYALVDRCLVHTATAVRYGVAMAMLGLMPLAALATFVEQERLVVHVGQGEQTLVGSHVGSLHTAIVTEAPFAAPTITGSELWIAGHTDRLMPWIDGVWLAGVCLLALRATGGWWRLRSLRSKAQLPVPDAVQQSFARVVEQLRLVQPVVLRVSRDVISPMAMGVWWTTVLLPLSVVTSLPAAQLEAVLAHELAHIRRWDYFCNLLQTAIECLFFFHPAVWWMSSRTRELREVCCDEVAARTCTDPGIYAEALLQMEEHRVEHLQLAVALHGKGGTLLNRIRRVMGERTMEYGSMSVVRVAAAGLVVAGLVFAPHVEKRLMAEPARAQSVPLSLVASASDHNVATMAADVRTESVSLKLSEELSQAAPAPTLTPGSAPTPASVPSPAPDPTVAPEPTPAPSVAELAPTPAPAPRGGEMQDAENAGGRDYLQKMRDAGYPLDLNNDLDTIVSLRSVGVTPEYAKAIVATGMGTPSSHDLVSMKAQGITPEYVAQMKAAGLAPDGLHELISMKAVGVTPEYARAMAATGIGKANTRDLVSMKAQGITPEYVAQMKAAGLGPDNLNELISMKAVGVTPEYAKAMAATGIGKATTHDLVSMKAQGIDPEYVAQMKAAGLAPDSLHELISLKAVGVTPEYAKAMAGTGIGTPTTHDLVSMKAQGITPEYVAQMKAAGLGSGNLHELISMKAVGVTPEYAKTMADAGFPGMPAHELVSLKAQGVTPESVRWTKATFPNADLQEVRKAATFHIDEQFLNKAKAHGFNSTDLDKLVKLKMTGLLD
jgi:bla regulator protein blaR1